MKTHALPTSTILIVDDESDTLNALLDALNQAQYKMFAATDGAGALQQIAEMPAPPDLILLDIMMPGIDGFETCRRLKADAATRDIPVLFMTALSATVDKVIGFAAGGVDYITKPFQIEEVLARVNAHLALRRQQQIIAAQNAELHTLNAQKDKFFSILGHDLKNPLSGFLSFADLLEHDFEAMTAPKRAELIQCFRASADMLFALLDNLLTWGRLQNGQLKCSPFQFPLDRLVAGAVTLLTPNALSKQITLTNAALPIKVYADMTMVETVVRNLIANAIKFTPPGGTVTIAATQTANDVRVTVADTGIGIPPDKAARLFRIDGKTQRSGTADEKGTGLGLILCKEFVEKHGGQIWVESEPGNGTRVMFTLPMKSNDRCST